MNSGLTGEVIHDILGAYVVFSILPIKRRNFPLFFIGLSEAGRDAFDKFLSVYRIDREYYTIICGGKTS